MKSLIAAAAVAMTTGFVALAPAGAAHAQAGLLSGLVRLDQPITLSSGKPLTEKPYELEAGKYYRLTIVSDGSAELALVGPEFFHNIWVNEVVINDIEVRPIGLSSFEFDDEGEIEMSFVPIQPGTYELGIPGASSDSQKAVFIVK